jgi:hypothetical protein
VRRTSPARPSLTQLSHTTPDRYSEVIQAVHKGALHAGHIRLTERFDTGKLLCVRQWGCTACGAVPGRANRHPRLSCELLRTHRECRSDLISTFQKSCSTGGNNHRKRHRLRAKRRTKDRWTAPRNGTASSALAPSEHLTSSAWSSSARFATFC